MTQNQSAKDPLEFVRGMWNNMGFSLPGMVTPTLDIDELDKRIADLKAVENWLKMNLNMLQMTTQGLEMQRAALAAVKAMSEHARESADARSTGGGEGSAFAAAAAMWPWNMMTPQQPNESSPQPSTRSTEKTDAPADEQAASRKSASAKK